MKKIALFAIALTISSFAMCDETMEEICQKLRDKLSESAQNGDYNTVAHLIRNPRVSLADKQKNANDLITVMVLAMHGKNDKEKTRYEKIFRLFLCFKQFDPQMRIRKHDTAQEIASEYNKTDTSYLLWINNRIGKNAAKNSLPCELTEFNAIKEKRKKTFLCNQRAQLLKALTIEQGD